MSIGTYAGIPVKIHWSFSLTLVLIGFIAYSNQLTIPETLSLSLFLFCLFFCVVLHEYGHALMARRYGVPTYDIVLSPVGGVARLQRMPRQPIQEFNIAIAGPLVNVAIAIILAIILCFTPKESFLPSSLEVDILSSPAEFLSVVLLLNVILFLFNLIPAFPMDGGRILRAILAVKLDYLKATQWAARISKILCIGFVFYGIREEMTTLPFIGVFIFWMASQEEKMVREQYEREEQNKIAVHQGSE